MNEIFNNLTDTGRARQSADCIVELAEWSYQMSYPQLIRIPDGRGLHDALDYCAITLAYYR